MTPGSIKAEYFGKSISIDCETFLPGFGSPDVVIYLSSINCWDAPHHQLIFTEEDRKKVVESLKDDLAKRDMTCEFE
jgi:Immunity protein 74